MEIVTGYKAQPHITATKNGTFNAGTFGSGSYVLTTGEQLSATMITNNLCRIACGDIIHQGRHITIPIDTYDEVEIANGLQGLKRNDFVVCRYSKDASTGIESAELVVLQGTSTEGTPSDPAYTEGNILEGDLVSDFPLYRIQLDGINVSATTKLFTIKKDLVSHSETAASSSVLGHVKYGNTSGTACQGNDTRLSNARTPVAHTSSDTTYGAATTSLYGHTKLSSSTNSDSTTLAATPSAVKSAYNHADDLLTPSYVTITGIPDTPTGKQYGFSDISITFMKTGKVVQVYMKRTSTSGVVSYSPIPSSSNTVICEIPTGYTCKSGYNKIIYAQLNGDYVGQIQMVTVEGVPCIKLGYTHKNGAAADFPYAQSLYANFSYITD